MDNLEKFEELRGLVMPQQIPFSILHPPYLNVSVATMRSWGLGAGWGCSFIWFFGFGLTVDFSLRHVVQTR